jgi:HK97 family phage major capsid protein
MPTTPYLSRTDALSLIVEQRSRQILALAQERSVAMETFRIIPLSTSTLKMPMLATFPSAKWLAAGAPPNDDVDIVKKPVTKMSWTDQDLFVEEAAVIVVIPENVIDDAEYNIWAEVESRCAEAIAQLIDMACFFGTAPLGGTIPASFPVGGIYGRAVAAANVYDPGSDTTAPDMAGDINGTLALVEEDGYDANRMYSGTGVRASLRNLRDANGGLLYASNLQGSTPVNTVWGVPISYVTNGAWDATKAQIIAGDPQMAVIGLRQKLTAKRLDQATVGDINLAEQDALALRVKIRLGFTVLAPIGIATPVDAFPFAVLGPKVVTP